MSKTSNQETAAVPRTGAESVCGAVRAVRQEAEAQATLNAGRRVSGAPNNRSCTRIAIPEAATQESSVHNMYVAVMTHVVSLVWLGDDEGEDMRFTTSTPNTAPTPALKPVWQGDLDPITGLYIRDPNRVYTAEEEAEIAQHNDIMTRCRQRKEAQAKEAKERAEERERAERERAEQANGRSVFTFDDIPDDDPTPNGHAPSARERLAAFQAEQAEIEEEHEARRQRKRRRSGEPEEPKRTDAEWIAYHTQRSNVVTFPTRHAQTKPAEKKPSENRRLRDSLNNHLCGKLADCETSAKLLDAAQRWNAAQSEPLPSAVVEKSARKVWQDYEAGALKPWRGLTSKAAQDDATINKLCQLDPRHAGDAWLFLTKLRYLHAARCLRGETFNITPTEMVAAQVIPGWSQHRYERARNVLIEAGLIGAGAPLR